MVMGDRWARAPRVAIGGGTRVGIPMGRAVGVPVGRV